jgi:hypothetical protein
MTRFSGRCSSYPLLPDIL